MWLPFAIGSGFDLVETAVAVVVDGRVGVWIAAKAGRVLVCTLVGPCPGPAQGAQQDGK